MKHFVKVESHVVSKAYLVINDARKLHQSSNVQARVDTNVVAVAKDVVKFVNIDRVALVCHNIEQEPLARILATTFTRAATANEVFNEVKLK